MLGLIYTVIILCVFCLILSYVVDVQAEVEDKEEKLEVAEEESRLLYKLVDDLQKQLYHRDLVKKDYKVFLVKEDIGYTWRVNSQNGNELLCSQHYDCKRDAMVPCKRFAKRLNVKLIEVVNE